MKRLFCLSILLLAGAVCWSCSDDENGGGDDSKGDIVLDKGTQTEQVVYANDKGIKHEGIKFATPGPWKAEVKEVSTKAVAETAQTVDWLTLSQYSGDKAGDYTITLTLKQNFTGKSRKAEIRIICGDTVITITVEQKAEKEDGKKLKRVKSVTYRDIFGPGYKEVHTSYTSEKGSYTYSYDERGRVAKVVLKSEESNVENTYNVEDTYTYRFDYHIVGEIMVDCHHEYRRFSYNEKYEEDSKYFLTLNEQGNVVRIKGNNDYDGYDRDVQIDYTEDGRLGMLAEENEDWNNWYQKVYYTDGLLTKLEYWEAGDSAQIEEHPVDRLYPRRIPANSTNIDFNAFFNVMPGFGTLEDILYQIGLFGKGSDCLVEMLDQELESLLMPIPNYYEPNKVHAYTNKYIKYLRNEMVLPIKYEFDGDQFVTKFWYEEPYELWEHKYEDHVGNIKQDPNYPSSPYEFERVTIYDKLLNRDEKNTYVYTVVYE